MHTLVLTIEKIMNFTNCTRVPIPQATTQRGTPGKSGLAPANSGRFPDIVSHDETHDGVIPNPSGRIAPDNEGKRPKLLSCRNRVFISTLNTRTLNPKGRLNELVHSAKKQLIDIIAVQEHCLFHPDTDIQYQTIDGYQLVTASCSKNSMNASVGGVGF